MRVELGAPVVIVAGSFGVKLWHVPSPTRRGRNGTSRTLEASFERMLTSDWPTRCGLDGELFAYDGVIRESGTRHCCTVCLPRSPHDLVVPATGPLPANNGRGGGRARGTVSRISEEQLAAFHLLYVEKGLSCRQIANRVWRQLGYKSPRSCGHSIWSMFRDRGFPLRERIEATRLASTRHGLAPKHGPRPGYGRYNRTVVRGQPDQPKCVATNHRGRRCGRKAMYGFTHCDYHEPSRAERRAADLATMRARSPRHMPENLIMVGEIREELADWFDEFGRTWRPLVAATRMSNSALKRYLDVFPAEKLMLRETAQRIRDGMAATREPGFLERVPGLTRTRPEVPEEFRKVSGQVSGVAHAVSSGERAHPWADVLQELTGQSFEVRFRHELEPSRAALVERLGGVIVIDPAAPRCAGACETCGHGELA